MVVTRSRRKTTCGPRVCFALPYTDGILTRVEAATEGTEYAEARGTLLSMLTSGWPEGVYGTEPSVFLEKFITGDSTITYNQDGEADILQKWGQALHQCSETSKLQGGALDVLDYVQRGVAIAEIVAKVCCMRYLYEDISAGLNLDEATALGDAHLVEEIIERAIINAGLSPIGLVELLRLLTVFSNPRY